MAGHSWDCDGGFPILLLSGPQRSNTKKFIKSPWRTRVISKGMSSDASLVTGIRTPVPCKRAAFMARPSLSWTLNFFLLLLHHGLCHDLALGVVVKLSPPHHHIVYGYIYKLGSAPAFCVQYLKETTGIKSSGESTAFPSGDRSGCRPLWQDSCFRHGHNSCCNGYMRCRIFGWNWGGGWSERPRKYSLKSIPAILTGELLKKYEKSFLGISRSYMSV